MIDLRHAHQEFDNYLREFDCDNEKIKLKIIHTDGVVCCASEITRRMGLLEEDCQLAELIALLHDIGRFEQIRKFDSFEPTTMDHAAFGVEMLFGERNMIRRFVQENTWDEIIREAIARHSSYCIGEGLNARELLHAGIIRDADKLDNCRVKLEESIEVLLGTTAEEVGAQSISEEVWRQCLERKSILSETRKTRMDYWVSYIAYFFDINYPETFEIIKEKQYVDRLISRIPYSNPDTEEKMKKLRENMICYMNEKKCAEGGTAK